MGKLRNPHHFSDHFGIPPKDLKRLGVLDPTLNADIRLFIDPLLLAKSRHSEMATGAQKTYEKHFTKVINFLHKTKSQDDVAWRSARRLLAFPEIKWTCLGYGAGSVSGSGSGNEMTAQYIDTARQIVELGVKDPDLFISMALFEDGVGPDRISDMTTNVIFDDLLHFNKRVIQELNIPTEKMVLRLKNEMEFQVDLPNNPFIREGGPIVLVPADILRELPIVKDWSEIADAASKNRRLRNRVNRQIAKLWGEKSHVNKDELRRWAMSGKEEFEAFLDMIRCAEVRPYDTAADPLGELIWRQDTATLAKENPVIIKPPDNWNADSVAEIVEQIIKQFRFLIEDRRLSEELYHDDKPRPEKSVQRLFFAIADSYCKANNLDLTPEADTGNGQVDFKVSSGYSSRVLVEIKLSKNSRLVQGYTRQLEAYKTAEQTMKAFYLVIDVGGMGEKYQKLQSLKNEEASNNHEVSPIILVDGIRKVPASRL